MVPKGGVEPPRVAPHAPQTCASASSATSARAVVSQLLPGVSNVKPPAPGVECGGGPARPRQGAARPPCAPAARFVIVRSKCVGQPQRGRRRAWASGEGCWQC